MVLAFYTIILVAGQLRLVVSPVDGVVAVDDDDDDDDDDGTERGEKSWMY